MNLQNIPKHWEVKKLKYVVDINPNVLSEKTEENYELKYIDISNVNEKGEIIATQEMIFKEAPSRARRIIAKGNTIISTVRTYLKAIAYINDENLNLIASTGFAVLRAKEGLDGKFLFYSVRNEDFIDDVCANSVGVSYPAITSEELGNICVALPPLPEQHAIADYLDRKTAEIDGLISKKTQLIALLKEEEKAFINERLEIKDKRLEIRDERLEIKDKRLEIRDGEWQRKKLKYLVAKIGSGITPKGGSETYLNEGVIFLRSQNIHFEGLRLDDVAYISEETHQEMSNSQVQKGDVLLNITGASIGRCYFWDSEIEANVNQHVCIIRPLLEFLETKYLYFLLGSPQGQELIDLCQNGANREGLNFQQISNFSFFIPSLPTQARIVGEIEAHLGKSRAIGEKLQREIELLKEYRQSLISEAVTGCLDKR